MSGRESLLAEIEARRRAQAQKGKNGEVEILAADLSIAPEDTSYDPYDKPGPAKPLNTDRGIKLRGKALSSKKRR